MLPRVSSSFLENVETVTAVIGGCAALGSVLMCALEIRNEERHWDEAIGWGSVAEGSLERASC